MRWLNLILPIAAITGALLTALPAHAQTIQASKIPPVDQTTGLAKDLTPPGTEATKWVFAVHRYSLGFVNIAAIIAIVFLAFSQVLKPAWSAMAAYEIKKSLPQLIIGVILANFSLLIVRFLVDISNALTQLSLDIFPGGLAGLSTGIARAFFMDPAIAAAGSVSALLGGEGILSFFGLVNGGSVGLLLVFFAFLLSFIPGIIILALGAVLYVRIPVIYFLAAISPLAFGSLGVAIGTPFRKWWQLAFNWIFMVPAVFLILGIVATLGGVKGTIFSFAVAIALFIIAIRLPFRMGGDIMTAWNKAIKGAAGFAWQGYGSLMKSWTDAPPGSLRQRIAKASNIYGIKEAVEQRVKKAEEDRMKAFRKGVVYRAVAGTENAGKTYFEANREVSRNINDPDEAFRKFVDPNVANGRQLLETIDQSFANIQDPAQREAAKEKALREFVTGPFKQWAKWTDEWGLDAEKAMWARLLMAQMQFLQTRARLPIPLTQTFDVLSHAALIQQQQNTNAAAQFFTETIRPPRQQQQQGQQAGAGNPYAAGGANASPDQDWKSAINTLKNTGTFTPFNLNEAGIEQAVRGHLSGHTPEEIAQAIGIDAESGAAFRSAIEGVAGNLSQHLDQIVDPRIEPTFLIRPKLQVQDTDLKRLRELYRQVSEGIGKKANIEGQRLEAIPLLVKLNPDLKGPSSTWGANELERNLKKFLLTTKMGLGREMNLPENEIKERIKVGVRKEYVLEQVGATLKSAANNDPAQLTTLVDRAINNENDALRKRIDAQLNTLKQTTGEVKVETAQFLRGLQQQAKEGKATSIKDLTDSLTLWDVHESAKQASGG
jgi:hypothetical protein